MRTLKAQIRRSILQKSREVEPSVRHEHSLVLTGHLLPFIDANLIDLKARGVAGFSSFADEIDMSMVESELKRRHIRFVPLTKQDTLDKAPALMLVPGVAFDLAGNRLGRGIAYFDQLIFKLRSLGESFVAIGIGYDHQVLDVVPKEEHDQPVDYICTPQRGLVKCTPSFLPTNSSPS